LAHLTKNLSVRSNNSNNAEHESFTRALNMKQKIFSKEQKIKVMYKRDLECIHWFQRLNEVTKPAVKPEHSVS
jgi:hypothetical protein